MGFLTPLLLAGAALVAIPIVLHLVMRRQARQLTFPALRFVAQRRDANRRRLRLRHLLLLALRCLLVAGIAVALARPTVKGYGMRGKEGAPLAVAVVVDNSLRMQYVNQNRSRLEQAADVAASLIAKLPEDAAVAVCDLGRAASGFAPDLSAAASRVRNLRPAADARPLAVAVVDAIRLVAEHQERRQELLVFTDMTTSAWSDDAVKAIAAALAEAPDVRVYVFDVGVASPKNASLGELKLHSHVLRPGEPLHIEAPVTSNLGGEAPLVELRLAGDDGRLEKRREGLVELGPDGQGVASFEARDLPLGAHQGVVQLAAADPLAADNARYFTVEVRPPARVLLLAERDEEAQLLREALSPSLAAGATRFECQIVAFAETSGVRFDDFQVVLVLDPGPLDDALWNRLADFAAGGGGVGVFLGHRSDFEAFNAEAPQRVLPGKLQRISRDATYLRPRRLDHPALAGLRRYAEGFPWPLCKVFRYWQIDELAGDAYAVANYANGDAAILERTFGRGRMLTVTTPFSDALTVEGREPWNLFLSQDVAYPFVALSDQLAGYLAQDADQRLDYLAGETAHVRLAPRQQVQQYVLRTPDGQAVGRIASGDDLAVSVTDQLGNYRLTAGGEAETLDRGFSVNAAPEVSDLSRVDAEALLASFPEDRMRVAENLEEAEQLVNVGRSGRELYPWAIAIVAIVWGAEHVLANRFYRKPSDETIKRQ